MVNTFLFANNAISALASGISNVATSVTLTTGSGALFPSPSAGQQFALTFTDAATGLLNEIVYCTARTGDVLTIVRAQESTSALNWSAGDVAANLVTAASLAAFLQTSSISIRTKLVADTSFYVATTGNDSTGTGAIGSPWLTGQHAINVLASLYDLAGFQPTLNFGAGTFAGGITVPFLTGQASALIINGNGSGSTTINGRLIGAAGSITTIQNFTHTNGASDCYVIGTAGTGNVGPGMVFGACGGAHLYANAGLLNAISNYNITAGALTHYQSLNGGKVITGANGVTLSGTPGFTQFVFVDTQSLFNASVSPTVFTGGATGVRYVGDNLSMIYTNGSGANYFPGNSAGSVAHGAVYN